MEQELVFERPRELREKGDEIVADDDEWLDGIEPWERAFESGVEQANNDDWFDEDDL